MSCKLGSQCYVDKNGINHDTMTVPVILSDESQVVRYSWSEGKYFLKLLHGDENVNLERKDILSIFINHNTSDLPIGRFTNVRVEDKKLKADAIFDKDDTESVKIFKKLASGFLQSFSVGITVDEKVLSKQDGEVGHYDVTKWSISEASIVGVPAIPTAKTGLNVEHNVDLGENPLVATATEQLENSTKENNLNLQEQYNQSVLDLKASEKSALKLQDDLSAEKKKVELLQAEADKVATLEGQVADLEGLSTAKAESNKEIVAMAFEHKVSKEVALNMLNAETVAEAKGIVLDAQASAGGSQGEDIGGGNTQEENLQAVLDQHGITVN